MAAALIELASTFFAARIARIARIASTATMSTAAVSRPPTSPNR